MTTRPGSGNLAANRGHDGGEIFARAADLSALTAVHDLYEFVTGAVGAPGLVVHATGTYRAAKAAVLSLGQGLSRTYGSETRRRARPEEVADVISFLVSQRARFSKAATATSTPAR